MGDTTEELQNSDANPDGIVENDPGTKDDRIKDPPNTIPGILRQLGPGLIVAGSIVGSGELIATTVTGAKAGFWLLWLILIGCVIKVFVQGGVGALFTGDRQNGDGRIR